MAIRAGRRGQLVPPTISANRPKIKQIIAFCAGKALWPDPVDALRS
jgi:hypothetical protein